MSESAAAAPTAADAAAAAPAAAQDLYAVLGCAGTATQADLKKAFFKLALEYHPDRNETDTTATMMRINEAYAVLGDVQERIKYDALLACGVV